MTKFLFQNFNCSDHSPNNFNSLIFQELIAISVSLLLFLLFLALVFVHLLPLMHLFVFTNCAGDIPNPESMRLFTPSMQTFKGSKIH